MQKSGFLTARLKYCILPEHTLLAELQKVARFVNSMENFDANKSRITSICWNLIRFWFGRVGSYWVYAPSINQMAFSLRFLHLKYGSLCDLDNLNVSGRCESPTSSW